MSQHLQLLNTPSHGVDEVCKALQGAHATYSRFASVARLMRHMPPHTAQADVQTALASAKTAGFVADDGSGNYQLTGTGIRHARQVPDRFLYVT